MMGIEGMDQSERGRGRGAEGASEGRRSGGIKMRHCVQSERDSFVILDSPPDRSGGGSEFHSAHVCV